MFFESLETLCQQLTKDRQGQKLVFTNGCFDILHIGHIRYLQEAKQCGDLLCVALNSDRSVKELKGPERPLQSEQDRAEVLAALQAVDYTVIFDEPTPLQFIKAINPDVLVKGGDWSIDQIVGSDHVLSYGGEVKSLQFVQGRSTTDVVQRIKRL
ncbi:MAG: D-glycero-beta-D-manno-heptose 1-phosphate adenylyltransferase [Pseudomonadota bacterium]